MFLYLYLFELLCPQLIFHAEKTMHSNAATFLALLRRKLRQKTATAFSSCAGKTTAEIFVCWLFTQSHAAAFHTPAHRLSLRWFCKNSSQFSPCSDQPGSQDIQFLSLFWKCFIFIQIIFFSSSKYATGSWVRPMLSFSKKLCWKYFGFFLKILVGCTVSLRC